MEIRKLEELPDHPAADWGRNGYITDKIFVVSAIDAGSTFEFSLREKKQAYAKTRNLDQGEIVRLRSVVKQGHSFGAYHQEELIGWIICDLRSRNNSLFIESLLIHEDFRGQSIGRLLIKAVNREARELQCRIVELETQNTNYRAVQFYREAGFAITGINTKLYNDSAETALFMSFDLMR